MEIILCICKIFYTASCVFDFYMQNAYYETLADDFSPVLVLYKFFIIVSCLLDITRNSFTK